MSRSLVGALGETPLRARGPCPAPDRCGAAAKGARADRGGHGGGGGGGCGGSPPAVFAKGSLSDGDAAILRFLAAAEILETDLWQQYNELCGIQDREVLGGSGNKAFTAALQV